MKRGLALLTLVAAAFASPAAGSLEGYLAPVSEFPVPSAMSGPVAIVPGPDGALWFTELTANKIGRITTAGVVTEYPIATANSQPDGIALGP